MAAPTKPLQSTVVHPTIAAMSQRANLRSFTVRFALVPSAMILLGAATLLVAAPAHAASRQAREREARKACLVGNFAKGVSILSDLFLDTRDANYIFNQGRCLQQNHRYEDAISRFQEYLRVGKKISPEEKAETEKHIAECKELLGGQAGLQPSAQAAPAAAPVAPVAPVVVVQPPQYVVLQPPLAQAPLVQQTSAPPASRGSGLRTAGIITVAVGGAALVAGVVLNVTANGMTSDMLKMDGYTDRKESDRKSYETVGWASYGVGAACIATGAVLYFLGLRAAASAPAVALVPEFAPGQASAVLKGAF